MNMQTKIVGDSKIPILQRNIERTKQFRALEEQVKTSPDVKAARLYAVLAQIEKEIKKETNILPSRLLKQVQGEMQDIASKFPSIKLVEGKSKIKDARKAPKA